MRSLTIFSLICTFSLVCIPVRAERYAHRPFLTGEAFLALPPSERLSYATGIVEGILTAPYLGAPIERTSQLNGCLYGKNDVQLAGVLSDYLRQHSEERRYEMPSVTLRAFAALCSGEPQQ
jgi:hypothetical protein